MGDLEASFPFSMSMMLAFFMAGAVWFLWVGPMVDTAMEESEQQRMQQMLDDDEPYMEPGPGTRAMTKTFIWWFLFVSSWSVIFVKMNNRPY